MANSSSKIAKTNNLENGKEADFKITFGDFYKNEKGEIEFPPKNAKEYDLWLESILTDDIMEIPAEDNSVDKDEKTGKIIRIDATTGKVLTGKDTKKQKEDKGIGKE